MCRPSAAGVHWVMAAPSSRTQPPAAGQTPTIARTRDDLPEPLGPAIASALPALRLKLTPRTTGPWAPGGVTLNASTASTCAGGELEPRGGCRHGGEQVIEPTPALARRHEALPVGDRDVDRRQGTAGQNRAGDDDARRGLLLDDQISPDGEHQRLQRGAQ